MPNIYSNYSFTQNGVAYPFDNVFVPADAFRRGNLWVWGGNSTGQLGTNDITTKSTPVTTFFGTSTWKQVACRGSGRSAAIKIDGTLWNWGAGAAGALGHNSEVSSITPITTFAGGSNWKQVVTGDEFTAAVKLDGTLWVWGQNLTGSLGINDATTINKLTPVTTFLGGNNWDQVAAANSFVAAIKTDGTLWTWGSNAYGQLGINDTTDRLTPVTTFLGGTNWRQVTTRDRTISATKTDGTLWLWGRGLYGRLGTNDTTDRLTPVTTFLGGTNWTQVESGYTTVAIKNDGTLWTWGRNNNAQLGVNDGVDRSTPVTTFTGGTNWKNVFRGGSSVGGIKTDGTLWVWGQNNNAQLGTNDTITKSTPVTTFLGGNKWKQAYSAVDFTLAVEYVDYLI